MGIWKERDPSTGDIILCDFETSKNDPVSNPSHYQGKYGMEAIEIIDNFIGQLAGKAAWSWGNAIKYLVRFQNKNGLEDLKKARKNIDYLIAELEKQDD